MLYILCLREKPCGSLLLMGSRFSKLFWVGASDSADCVARDGPGEAQIYRKCRRLQQQKRQDCWALGQQDDRGLDVPASGIFHRIKSITGNTTSNTSAFSGNMIASTAPTQHSTSPESSQSKGFTRVYTIGCFRCPKAACSTRPAWSCQYSC